MAVSVGNLAPRAIVLGLVAVGVWPSVSHFLSEDKPPAPEAMPELAASLLSPKLAPRPERDPFGLVATRQVSAKEAAKLRAARSAAAAGRNGPPAKPVDPLSGLILTATCIVGDQRLAVINGRLYAPKETVVMDKLVAKRPANAKGPAPAPAPAAAEAPAAAPYQVVDVFPYRVLLAHNGQLLELGYSNTASGPPSVQGAWKASSGGARKGRGSSGKSGRKT
jgi:hypothetical protein